MREEIRHERFETLAPDNEKIQRLEETIKFYNELIEKKDYFMSLKKRAVFFLDTKRWLFFDKFKEIADIPKSRDYIVLIP